VPEVFIKKDCSEANKTQLKNCLNLLVDAKRFPNTDVDGVVDEMCNFRDESQHCSELNAQFQAFSTSDRLDTFWHAILSKSTYKKLWNVVQMLMLLSHGQATVERGFSFNKEIMTHSMKERTVVALRAVVDHVAHVGGLDKMTITKKMLLAAGSAKTAYNNYLAEEKEQNAKAQKTQKRKALLDELDELKKKKRRTEEGIKALEQAADEYAEAMERKGDLKIIAKFNAMRRSLKTKQQELDTLELNIKEKVDEIAAS
jgi:hypothetical protein